MRANLRESEIEDADEREKSYYLRMKESHPDGKFFEDPRGRALEYDYEIEADVDEELNSEFYQTSSLTSKIKRSNKYELKSMGSRDLMEK